MARAILYFDVDALGRVTVLFVVVERGDLRRRLHEVLTVPTCQDVARLARELQPLPLQRAVDYNTSHLDAKLWRLQIHLLAHVARKLSYYNEGPWWLIRVARPH